MSTFSNIENKYLKISNKRNMKYNNKKGKKIKRKKKQRTYFENANIFRNYEQSFKTRNFIKFPEQFFIYDFF